MVSRVDDLPYPNTRDGFHRVMPHNDHDHPTDSSQCRCHRAPTRSTLAALTDAVIADRALRIEAPHQKPLQDRCMLSKEEALAVAAFALRVYEETADSL